MFLCLIFVGNIDSECTKTKPIKCSMLNYKYKHMDLHKDVEVSLMFLNEIKGESS